jgi:phage terminase large subunit GpA-like protein
MMERLPLPQWRIPAFSNGRDIFHRQAHHARPQEKLSVSQFAIRYQNYDPDIFPWQVEIMDGLSDPVVSEEGLLGPSQTGKTTIGLAWMGRNVHCDPADFQVTQPTQKMAGTFSTTRIDAMIEGTNMVKRRVKPVLNAIQTYTKQFTGMNVYVSWPSPAEFTQRPIRDEWADDYDQVDADIGGTEEKGGQGSLAALMQGRQTSFEGRSTLFISSTPADDEGGKTEAYVRSGTFERLHPECPSCGDRWEIDVVRDLKFEAGSSPDRAAETAHVVCGANGCILLPRDRRKLLAGLSALPNKGFVSHNPDGSKGVRTFWPDGLMCMSSWPEIAKMWRAAQIAWEERQDEGPLRTVWQTKFGKNYRSKLSGEKPLAKTDIEQLKDEGFASGIIPVGPKVWTLAVDVQGNRFECIAVGYADGHESWIIKRWTLDVLEDGLTTLEPFRKPEHWRILLPLFDKTWELAGGGRSPPPLVVAIDTGGGGDKDEATATENAKRFWHLAREAGIKPNRIMLLKGSSSPNSELVRNGQFSDKKMKGTPIRSGPMLWLVNVHKVKNIMDARLRRTDKGGKGRIHLPADFDEEHIAELTAEELKKGKWTKTRSRNETWDLIVYAWAALIKPPFAKSRDHMRWIPAGYRIQGNASVKPEALPGHDDAGVPDRMPAATPTAEGVPVRPRRAAPPRKNWFKGRR